MKSYVSTFGASAIAALAVGFSGGAAAQSSWSLANGGGGGIFAGSSLAGTGTGTGGLGTAGVAGYGFSSGGAGYVISTLTNQGAAGIGSTSAGGESGTAPDHAFDNRAGGGAVGTATNEVLLINFGTVKAALSSVTLGWATGDSDVSVLRWDGSGDPTSGLVGSTPGPAALAGKGWTLVSSMDVDGSGGNIGDTDYTATGGKAMPLTGSTVSSWWLISTYFGTTAGAVDAAGKSLDAGNDFFKLLGFAGKICAGSGNQAGAGSGAGVACTSTPGGSVPEPGSMALAALAILGAVGARRRSIKATA